MIRIDSEGRDVTDLPGLWSEDDTEHVEPDLKSMMFKGSDLIEAQRFLDSKDIAERQEILYGLFLWHDSPQGVSYWDDLQVRDEDSIKPAEEILSPKVDSIIRSFIVAYHRQNP